MPIVIPPPPAPTSAPLALPTVPVWDYIYEPWSPNTGPPPPVPPGTEVKIQLQTTTGQVDAPAVLVDNAPIVVKTDANGYWSVYLVPNFLINLGNSWWSVQTSTRVYDIFVGAGGGQSQAMILNQPISLPPGTTVLSGPLTVPGLLTAQAGLDVSGAITAAGGLNASGPITFPAASIPIADVTPLPATDSLAVHLAGAETITGAKTLAGHILSTGALPTITPLAALGGSPPALGINPINTDTRGSISWGTGTAPSVGAVVRVVFAVPYATPPIVLLTPNIWGTTGHLYVSFVGTASFEIGCNPALAASQPAATYGCGYHVIG